MQRRIIPLLVAWALVPMGCDRGPDWDDLGARPLTAQEMARLQDRAERIEVGEVVTKQSKAGDLRVKSASQTAVYRAKGASRARLWVGITCRSTCETVDPVPSSTPATTCPNIGCVPKGTTCTAPDCDVCPTGPCTKSITGFGDLGLVLE